jgi:hypothetical protein
MIAKTFFIRSSLVEDFAHDFMNSWRHAIPNRKRELKKIRAEAGLSSR